MAQAARLSLRLQKEFKLLIADPPPGVTFPLLSDSSSLSCIEARIEGPEETVYSNGIFTLSIQLPERYPFQPPNVTFVTPIYHPNIDDGGRICLDILNLPPKGAWQPSMNISTILTSIRLLLSEPNPDDGLMAEASKEYKYNRQAFDQKARSWTQLYANTKSTERSNTAAVLTSLNTTLLESDKTDCCPQVLVHETGRTRKKLRLGGQSLSRKSEAPSGLGDDDKENFIPARRLSMSQNSNPMMLSSSSALSKHSSAEVSQNFVNGHGEKPLNEKGKQVVPDRELLETIIVPDSDESDDEGGWTTRSRLTILRKQITGNIKK